MDTGSIPIARAADATGSRATALLPGEVEVAQYGEYEDLAVAPVGEGARFLAVRFELPYDPPFTITKVSFPSLTANGVPAIFPSVRLCPYESEAALVNLGAPVVELAPFVGSANGWNEVPINLEVTEAGKIFYWCIEFPTRGTPLPDDYPRLRSDFRDTERGYFGDSYAVLPDGFPLRVGYNLVVSMFCQLPSPDLLPITSTRNLGANPRSTKFEFTYDRPADIRADGAPMQPHSLARTDLLFRPSYGPWMVVGSGGAGTGSISVDLEYIRYHTGFWATQAVDKNGRRALPSNVVEIGPPFFASQYDRFEPNGRTNEATPITAFAGEEVDEVFATSYPAGDQDYYSFTAPPGALVNIYATEHLAQFSHLDPVLFLYDGRNRLVASDDNSGGGQDALISYRVPRRASPQAERFTVQVADARHSPFSPNTAPRVMYPSFYGLFVWYTPPDDRVPVRDVLGQSGGDVDFTVSPGSGGQVRLDYTVPASTSHARVLIRLFDVRGRLIRTLVDRQEGDGVRSVVWDGRGQDGRRVSSGVYFARLEVGDYLGVRRISLYR